MSDKRYNCKPDERRHEFNNEERCQCGAFTAESLQKEPPKPAAKDEQPPARDEHDIAADNMLQELHTHLMLQYLADLYNETETLLQRSPGFRAASRPLLTVLRKIRKLRGGVTS